MPMTLPEIEVGAYEQLPGSVYASTDTLRSGTHALQNVDLDIATPSAASGIFFGAIHRTTYRGVGGFSGAGHQVSHLAWSRLDAAGQTHAALYASESKLEVLAGNATLAIAHEVQISAVPVGSTAVNFLAGAVRVGANEEMGMLLGSSTGVAINGDGIAAPAAIAGYDQIFRDGADGLLKVRRSSDGPGAGALQTITVS